MRSFFGSAILCLQDRPKQQNKIACGKPALSKSIKTNNMKTKNLTAIIAIVIITTLFGCKREALTNEPVVQQNSISEKVKAWFEKQPKAPNYRQVLFESKTINLPEEIAWMRSKYNAEAKINITPINIKSVDRNLPAFKYLVTNTDEGGGVLGGYYYTILSNKKTLDQLENEDVPLMMINLEQIPKNFTGTIIKQDLNNTIIWSKHYEQGTIVGKADKIEARKSKDQTSIGNYAPLEEGCNYVTIEWYWQTWQNGVLIYEEYVGSSIVVVCEGTGGGGGGGGVIIPGPCSFTLAEAQQQLNAITIERNYQGECSTPIGEGVSQFSNWPKLSPKNCSTGLVTLHFFGGYYVSYACLFTGTVKKDGPNVPWKWQTFAYNSTVLTGGGIPPCFEQTKSVVANPVISQDGLTVGVAINYTITTKILCLFGWQPSAPYTGSFVHTFNAN